MRPILEAVRGVHLAGGTGLDRASEDALAVIAGMQDEPPFVQGYELAGWLRSEPEVVRRGGRVDPDKILEMTAYMTR